MEILFVIGRILFGGFFFLTGINHLTKSDGLIGYAAAMGVPLPRLAVLGSGVVLLLAGIGIVLGIYPSIALVLVLVFLLPVTFTMHRFWNHTDDTLKMNDQINFMKNMALIGATIMLLTLPLEWVYSVITL
ncbi:MAG: DoxX family protein [Candidatus Paceibacterota bacterium]